MRESHQQLQRNTANLWQFTEKSPASSPSLAVKPSENDRSPRLFLKWIIAQKFHEKVITIYPDRCLPANNQKIVCQTLGLNRYFEHSMISNAIETSIISGLDIILPAPRKSSFDSLDERRKRLKNGNLLSTRKQHADKKILWLTIVQHSILGSKFWLVR